MHIVTNIHQVMRKVDTEYINKYECQHIGPDIAKGARHTLSPLVIRYVHAYIYMVYIHR